MSGCELWYYSRFTGEIRLTVYEISERDEDVWIDLERDYYFLSEEDAKVFVLAQQVIEKLSASTR